MIPSLRQSDSTRTGVSPVVAVILLVAVTVTLSAVIGGFALNLGQSTTSSQNSNAGVTVSETADSVSIQVVSADETVYYRLPNGTTERLGSVGDSVTLTEGTDYSAGDEISILLKSDDGTQLVQSVETENTTSTTSTTSTLVVDTFADTDLSEYAGETAAYSFDSTIKTDDSPSLTVDVDGGNAYRINSTSGLSTYPEAGDTIRTRMRWDNGTVAHTMVRFGIQNKNNLYSVELDARKGQGGNSEAKIVRVESGTVTKLANTSALELENYNNEWVTLEVTWGSSGDIQTTWYAANGSVITQLNVTDTTFSSGGIGFLCNDSSVSSPATCWYDEYEVER